MANLEQLIIEVSKKDSNFNQKRDYIGLSKIYKSVEELLQDHEKGLPFTDETLLKCGIGHIMERAMIERLKKIEGFTFNHEVTVSQSKGLIKGHPDFKYFDVYGDIKSFALDNYMPVNGRVSRKIFFQANAYMLYSKTNKFIFICESRESGMIKVIEVFKSSLICDEIHWKVSEILKLL
jgi:hypothetical protein